jgi:hypothetical protein
MQLATLSASTDDDATETDFFVCRAVEDGHTPAALARALSSHLDGYDDAKDPAYSAVLQTAADILLSVANILAKADALPTS